MNERIPKAVYERTCVPAWAFCVCMWLKKHIFLVLSFQLVIIRNETGLK